MNTNTQVSRVSFSKGAYIIVEGKAEMSRFYIIQSGVVRLTKSTEVVQEESGNILNPGDFFGVISAMSSQRSIETARALTDCVLIAVHKDEYGNLIKHNTAVAMKIIESFSRRMRYLDAALANISGSSSGEVQMDHMFNIAKYYEDQQQYDLAYYVYYQFVKQCPQDPHVTAAKEIMEGIKDKAKSVVHLEEDSSTEFIRKYPKNTMIFSEMMHGKEMYIIQQGSVKITKVINNTEVLLAILRTGDIFGEMALVEQKPRSASAISYEDAVLLSVNRENFQRIVDTQPQVIVRLTALLAERIWVVYRQLSNAVMTNKVARMYDAILVHLEKLHTPIVDGQQFVLGFGPQELINWVGLSIDEGNMALRELLNNNSVSISDGKIHVHDTLAIVKEANYYQKMHK